MPDYTSPKRLSPDCIYRWADPNGQHQLCMNHHQRLCDNQANGQNGDVWVVIMSSKNPRVKRKASTDPKRPRGSTDRPPQIPRAPDNSVRQRSGRHSLHVGVQHQVQDTARPGLAWSSHKALEEEEEKEEDEEDEEEDEDEEEEEEDEEEEEEESSSVVAAVVMVVAAAVAVVVVVVAAALTNYWFESQVEMARLGPEYTTWDMPDIVRHGSPGRHRVPTLDILR
ncbi:hypothetical protein EGW08_012067 [Elysia chlorotica]|uniref:Uncharacterized protein n=1 Tax=Elysia chlorotica TaxID=188477 RepID=A0A433TF32_ELYCH|nr:hypothetical protein EGW08_012067 [Elysia chlorotica]